MPPPAAQVPKPPPHPFPPPPEGTGQAQPAAPLSSGQWWALALEVAPTKQLRAILASLRPVELSHARWIVACDHPPMRKMVEVRLAEITDIVRKVSPAAMLELAPVNGAGIVAQPQATPASPGGPAEEPEIVRLAAQLFGAKVVNVQRKDRSDGNG